MPGLKVKTGFMGNAGCGKTQLVSRLAKRQTGFKEQYTPSIAPDLFSKTVDDTTFMLWDFPGHAVAFNASFISGVQIGVYCVDLSDRKAVDENHINAELASFKKINPSAVLVLVATKCDAYPDRNEALATLANLDVGHIKHRFLTSAKENTGLDTLEDCLKFVVDNHITAKKQQSSLSAEQIEEINYLITCLNREIESCWPYPNKDRKRSKVLALTSLIEKAETMSIDESILRIESEYPDVREGKHSTRTNDLLYKLQNIESDLRPY